METTLIHNSPSNLHQSLHRLRQNRDSAVAVLTVPTRLPTHSHAVLQMTRPVVDLSLWTDHVRYSRHRDPAALDTLVAHYGPHTEALARSLYRHGESVKDLTQTAFEALMVALQRFDPERNRPFLAYAKPTITGVIRRHYRDLGWSIRIPRRVHELAGPIRDAREMLVHDLGREPTPAEIADLLGIGEKELNEVLKAQEVRQPDSLDVVDPVSKLSTEQVVGAVDPGFAWTENHMALQQAMDLLPAKDRQLLHRYFLEEQTQAEIAKEYGCSQMQVSRLLASAIRRLRRRLVGI